MNEAELIRKAMSALGKRTSERKKISSRKNAKRPRKKKLLLDGLPAIQRKPETANAAILYPGGTAEVYLDRSQFPKA